jgi:hypothetical protein
VYQSDITSRVMELNEITSFLTSLKTCGNVSTGGKYKIPAT